jgi:hypothetical protein
MISLITFLEAFTNVSFTTENLVTWPKQDDKRFTDENTYGPTIPNTCLARP